MFISALLLKAPRIPITVFPSRWKSQKLCLVYLSLDVVFCLTFQPLALTSFKLDKCMKEIICIKGRTHFSGSFFCRIDQTGYMDGMTIKRNQRCFQRFGSELMQQLPYHFLRRWRFQGRKRGFRRVKMHQDFDLGHFQFMIVTRH